MLRKCSSRRFAIIWSSLSHIYTYVRSVFQGAKRSRRRKHLKNRALFSRAHSPLSAVGVKSQRMTLIQSGEIEREGGKKKINILLHIHAIACDPRWILTSAVLRSTRINFPTLATIISRATGYGERQPRRLLPPRLENKLIYISTRHGYPDKDRWSAFRSGFEPSAYLVAIYANAFSAALCQLFRRMKGKRASSCVLPRPWSAGKIELAGIAAQVGNRFLCQTESREFETAVTK